MGVGRIILGGPHPRRPSSVPVTKILSTYAHCRHPQYFCAKTKTSNKSQFVCPCHLGTPEPLSKGGIYEIYFSTDSNVKNTNKRDVEIPKKWNLPKAQWHTQDILQTPSCPSPGILQGHIFINTWACTGWFFNLFRPKFRAKKKNVAQPRRIFCTSRISDWLSIVFNFGTKNWEGQLKEPPCITGTVRVFQTIFKCLHFSSLSSSSIVGIVWEPIGVFRRTFKCSTIVSRCRAKPQSLKWGVLYR